MGRRRGGPIALARSLILPLPPDVCARIALGSCLALDGAFLVAKGVAHFGPCGWGWSLETYALTHHNLRLTSNPVSLHTAIRKQVIILRQKVLLAAHAATGGNGTA